MRLVGDLGRVGRCLRVGPAVDRHPSVPAVALTTVPCDGRMTGVAGGVAVLEPRQLAEPPDRDPVALPLATTNFWPAAARGPMSETSVVDGWPFWCRPRSLTSGAVSDGAVRR